MLAAPAEANAAMSAYTPLYADANATTWERDAELATALDTLWLLQSSIFIFIMQAGFALVEVGSVTSKSTQDIMLKNVMDVSTSLVIWWLCGSAIMGEGGNAFAGAIFTTLDGDEQQGLFTSRWLLGYMYVAASVTIVSGAIAERTRHPGYIFSSSLTALCIYPVIAHWVWASNGMFSRQNPKALLGGAIDFAGGGVVHVTGGTLALCASKLVGPRNGRFDSLTHQPLEMRGQSTSYIMIGTFFLWVGWLAFNMGSTLGISTRGAAQTAARVGSRTMLAGSAGCIAMTAINYVHTRSWSVSKSCFGILSGLVAITASCSTVGAWAAAVIGAVGACLFQVTSHIVLCKLRIDDVVDAFSIHAVPGAWGLIAASLFSDGRYSPGAVGLFYGGDGRLLAASLVLICAIVAWSVIIGGIGLMIAKRLGILTIPTDLQRFGSDVAHSPARRTAASCARGAGSAAPRVNMNVCTLASTPELHAVLPDTQMTSTAHSTEPMADATIQQHNEQTVRGGQTNWRFAAFASMSTATSAASSTAASESSQCGNDDSV